MTEYTISNELSHLCISANWVSVIGILYIIFKNTVYLFLGRCHDNAIKRTWRHNLNSAQTSSVMSGMDDGFKRPKELISQRQLTKATTPTAYGSARASRYSGGREGRVAERAMIQPRVVYEVWAHTCIGAIGSVRWSRCFYSREHVLKCLSNHFDLLFMKPPFLIHPHRHIALVRTNWMHCAVYTSCSHI